MHTREWMSRIWKCFSFGEITTESSCVFGFLPRHISTAESLSDLCLFLWSGNTVKGDWGVVSPYQAALSGIHRASRSVQPLRGDSAGFNYPQLCFISLPSWARCPSVLCHCAAFTLKSRWDTQMSAHTHTHREVVTCSHTSRNAYADERRQRTQLHAPLQ